MATLLGPDARKLQPKLRLFANGDDTASAIRAEQSSCIAVSQKVAEEVTPVRGTGAAPVSRQAQGYPPKGKLQQLAQHASVSVFIETVDVAERLRRGKAAAPIPEVGARKGNLGTATVSLARLQELAEHPEVSYIELGEPLAAPVPDISPARPKRAQRLGGPIGEAGRHRFGAGVLIGLFDVGGFDVSHPDFLDRDGNTRFVRIWDQGGRTRPSPASRDRERGGAGPFDYFDYGSELHQDDLNRALKAAPEIRMPARRCPRFRGTWATYSAASTPAAGLTKGTACC